MADNFQDGGKKESGIFIPYDKLLQQQSDKLDKILDELREFDRRKLDVAVFESFRTSYEQRHETLKLKIEHVDRVQEQRAPLIQEFEDYRRDIALLKKDKAERDAVKSQMRYIYTGAGLTGALVVTNLAINVWQLMG